MTCPQALNDKREFDGRQQDALNQLIKKQEMETGSLQASFHHYFSLVYKTFLKDTK